MWFRKHTPTRGPDRNVCWWEFKKLLDYVAELNVEIKCLRKGLSEQREYNFLIKEGWKQDQYRYWNRKASEIKGLYQDKAYELAKQMKYKRDGNA